MAHLSPDTLIDLLDGTVDETSVPHLLSCAACREQLAGLRATWQAAVAADMPEPSPLFWDHLSARIHEAVSAEEAARRGWLTPLRSWRFAVVAGAAAATIALAAGLQLSSRPTLSPSDALTTTRSSEGDRAGEPSVEPLADDESLGFVADLASNIDWDTVADQGLSAHGDADLALAALTEAERLELERLLHEELGQGSLM